MFETEIPLSTPTHPSLLNLAAKINWTCESYSKYIEIFFNSFSKEGEEPESISGQFSLLYFYTLV